MINPKNQNLYFSCFHEFQLFYLSEFSSPIRLFKNLSIVHSFLSCSLSHVKLWHPYLFFLLLLYFYFFLLSQGHMKQKNGGRWHGGSLFRCESARFGPVRSKKKKKNDATWTHGHWCRAPHTASMSVECRCGSSRAIPVLSSFHDQHLKFTFAPAQGSLVKMSSWHE